MDTLILFNASHNERDLKETSKVYIHYLVHIHDVKPLKLESKVRNEKLNILPLRRFSYGPYNVLLGHRKTVVRYGLKFA